MPLLKTVKPGEAEGVVKEVYDAMEAAAKTVPKPLQMASVSPKFLQLQSKMMDYYMTHPTLSFPLLAHIRYAVASHEGYYYCINFNAGILSMFLEVGEEQLEAIKEDPSRAKLDQKDKALFEFVVKAIKDPSSTAHEDADRLRGLGWKDEDIFDALAHGVNMVSAGISFKALKMDEDD